MEVYTASRSPSIAEKIKLFEVPPTPASPKVGDTGKSSPLGLKTFKVWRKDKSKDADKTKKPVTFALREEVESPTVHRLPTLPKETDRITPGHDSADVIKAKRDYPEIIRRDTTTTPHESKDLLSSRSKQKEKVRLEVDGDIDEDDIIKLHRLTVGEKQAIKHLVKVTKKRNKLLDEVEDAFNDEKQAITAQHEAEKAGWAQETQRLQRELDEKTAVLRHKETINNNMQTMLRKAHEDLHESQATVATYKRVLADFKKNTDQELYNKSQTLQNMDKKLATLHKLRESMDCIICEERVAKIVLSPCNHMVLCSKCSHLVTQCPMCRATVTSRFEIYCNWVL